MEYDLFQLQPQQKWTDSTKSVLFSHMLVQEVLAWNDINIEVVFVNSLNTS